MTKKLSQFCLCQFLAKIQGYSLTFWPKDGHFYWRIFWGKNCPNFFLVNLGQKCKAIALLFGQKLVIFIREIFDPKTVPTLSLSILGKNSFLLEKFLTQKLSQFCLCQFLAKIQGYSLTFWPKDGHFYWRIFRGKNCPYFFLVNLGQKCKAIALLFGQKLVIFIREIFDPKTVPILSLSILGKNSRL